MHVVVHAFSAAVVGGLVMARGADFADGLMVAMGGVLPDLDHILYFLVAVRPWSVEKIREMHETMYKQSQPGYFGFHTFEMILMAGVFAFLGVINRYLFLGYAIHCLEDVLVYLFKRKQGWLRHWSMLAWIEEGERQEIGNR